jgi:proteasome lid subunit RPN8/RPN11
VRPVTIGRSALETLRSHARRAYPDECCGFLVAPPDPGDPRSARSVRSVIEASNEYAGGRRRRFLVQPEELRAVERRLEGDGQVLAGFYHSHPDHPAEPSQFDQEHAWPWYSYLVVNVTLSSVGRTRAFELDPDSSEFHEVALHVEEMGPTGGRLTAE